MKKLKSIFMGSIVVVIVVAITIYQFLGSHSNGKIPSGDNKTNDNIPSVSGNDTKLPPDSDGNIQNHDDYIKDDDIPLGNSDFKDPIDEVHVNEDPIDKDSIEKNPPDVSEIVDVNTVKELRMLDLSIGQRVRTKGYNSVGDKGDAQYLIKNKNDIVEDGFIYIKLQNDLIAEIVLDRDSYVNVMAANIQTNTKISDQLNYMIKAISGKVKGIQFNSGIYYIDKRINLTSMDYIGNGTALSISKDFETKTNQFFSTEYEYKNNKNAIDISFLDIEFIYDVYTSFLNENSDTMIMCLMGIDHCSINNCKFITKPAGPNENSSSVTCLWFQQSDIKNVSINNCIFDNETGTGNDDKYMKGGCVWFKSTDDGLISNITITNSVFTTTTSDEIIAVWNAAICDAFHIQGNTLNVVGKHSGNAMAFYRSTFSDLVIDRNILNIASPCQRIIKFLGASEKNNFNVKVQNCEINLTNNLKSPWYDNMDVIQVSGQKGSDNTISVKNCTVVGKGNTQYRTLLTCTDTDQLKLEFSNNKLEFDAITGIWIENANCNLSVNKNTINLNAADFLYLKNLTGLTELSLTENTLESSFQANMSGEILLNYDFKNNIVNNTVWKTFFHNMGVNDTSKAKLNVENNTFQNKELVSYYFSQDKIPYDNILEINKD